MVQIPVQLVVCDIDDTLIHKDDHLNEEIIKIIQKLKRRGIQFTLATGRMPYRAESYARDAELTIPFIANNGSILFDRGRMVWSRMLYAKVIQEIHSIIWKCILSLRLYSVLRTGNVLW